jgi:hypothetical protein
MTDGNGFLRVLITAASGRVMKAKCSEDQEKALQIVGEGQSSKLTVLVCRIVCIGFALLEAWSQRRFINEDGISYLDMSDALIRHNWHLLINSIWSPLYPLLIGVATWLTRPSAQWEVPIVHALNFVIFLGALASFEFLLRQVIRVLRRENEREGADSAAPLPVWIWQLLGYSLFAWSTIGMIWAPRMVTPDLCVAIFVYLDAGLLLSLGDSAKQSRTCLLLGLTLGMGYLAKAILFPMAFLFMVVAFFMIGEWRKAVRPLAVTFLVFCTVAAPLVISMSRRVGRLSYSEAANMNYSWVVNHFNPYGSASGPSPSLKHPMTLFHRDPDVFGFREPLALTYPPRSDMGYWSAGVHVTINPRNQLRTVGRNLIVFFTNVHIVPMCGLIGGGVILLLMSPNEPRRFRSISRSWPLLVSGAVAPCLYLLVFVEPRYVAPFLVLVLLGFFPGILLRNPKDAAKRTVIPTVVIATSMMVLTALLVVYHLAGYPHSQRGEGQLFLQVGESLNAAGVRPGEDVGIIGGGVIGDSSGGCRWARMARVRIVAQMPSEEAADFFRVSSPTVKAEVYDAFARAGAKAVVAEETPPPGGIADWQRLGDTHYYVHFLAPVEQQSSYSY